MKYFKMGNGEDPLTDMSAGAKLQPALATAVFCAVPRYDLAFFLRLTVKGTPDRIAENAIPSMSLFLPIIF